MRAPAERIPIGRVAHRFRRLRAVVDARTTLTNAEAKGGRWHELAAARLTEPLRLAAATEARIAEARSAATPAIAALEAADAEADRLLGRTSDEIWNDVGRPGTDAALSILWPGGIGYYTDAPIEEQPVRMEILAGLLEAGVHRGLTPERGAEYASRVRGASARLRERVDAAREPRVRLAAAERMLTSVGKAVQIALVNLKRAYKSEGFTEAEIHAVIPDRPAKKKTPKAPPAA